MNNKNRKKVKVYSKKKHIPETTIIKNLQNRYDKIDVKEIKLFSDLPLSSKTLKGLKDNNFKVMTDIQRQSIGLALQGNDVLGAAKTGSGKTLAFLVPVLEILYCNRWTPTDGLGALIITPTRELAYQIYETLRKVGCYHDFSAALIIGGKDLKFETKRLDQCNIIICTPGRLLQHMDENPLFNCINMKILVLDEADRCLDMGFEKTMNSIIENLPPERHTLLFSATQTKSVRDLARLSLVDPTYISVHEFAAHTTPDLLQQSYIVCKLEEKLSVLWSFVRNHLHQKIILFFASCKQVKFFFEAFCRMRPGISLIFLHGDQHQMKRMSNYDSFNRKQHAVLFATDLAARGLDFPGVNWVVQVDCPEDVNSYIHRAGRTARFESGGESLLILLPSEEKFVEKLQERKIPISMIQINPNKLSSPMIKLERILSQDIKLKESAQRAFIAYIKSVFLMKDKTIFNVHALNTDAYAKSLGLKDPPRIRFLKKLQASKKEKVQNEDNKQNSVKKSKKIMPEIDEENSSEDSEDEMHKNFEKKTEMIENDLDDDDEEEDCFTTKRTNIDVSGSSSDEAEEEISCSKQSLKKPLTKAAVVKKMRRMKIVPNKKIVFNEEGQEVVDPTKSKLSEAAKEYENDEMVGIDIEKAKEMLREEDRFDKQRYREKIKERHREQKRKLKAEKQAEKEKSESDESESEDDDSGPDLSWLPDPDKVYGEKKSDGNDSEDSEMETSHNDDNYESNDSEESDADSELQSDEEQIHRPFKRKLVSQGENKKTKQKRLLPKIDSNTLQADEELALQLLRH